MKNEKIEQFIKENGYAVVNIQDTYFYTVGMAAHGKNDLFGIKQYPFGLFQVVAQRYFNDDIKINKPFFVFEYKIKGAGKEPTRCKVTPLKLETSSLITNALAKQAHAFETQGFNFVLGPDLNNQLIGEEECSIKVEIPDLISEFISAVNTDINNAKAEAEAKLNEAQNLLKSLGVNT